MTSYELRDKMEAWIMFVLILAFIACSGYYFYCSTTNMPSVKKVVVETAQVDSLRMESAYSREQVDSIIDVVRDYELKLDEKYQYLLDKREDDDRFKTWGALLIGLFVSVLGFFGYKSFKDIKNHSEEIAKTEANNIAGRVATSQAEATATLKTNEYLEQHLDAKITEAMTAHYNGEATNVLKQRIVDELRPVIDEMIDARMRDAQEEPEEGNRHAANGNVGENNNQEPLF
jgi:hypothetical protein